MTIKELIEKLSEFPGDYPVIDETSATDLISVEADNYDDGDGNQKPCVSLSFDV